MNNINKIHIEIVRDFNRLYYANVTYDIPIQPEIGLPHKRVYDLPELVDYRALKKAIKEKTGFTLPSVKTLYFEKYGRKSYAYIVSNI